MSKNRTKTKTKQKRTEGENPIDLGVLMAVMVVDKDLVGLNGQESDGWVVRLQEEDEENGGRPRVLMFEVG